MGDFNHRVIFTKVEGVHEFEQPGKLNTKQIFAGGNHTWLIVNFPEMNYNSLPQSRDDLSLEEAKADRAYFTASPQRFRSIVETTREIKVTLR